MSKITPYIPVVYCFDAKFSNYAAVSIFSLFVHTLNPIKVYCLVPSEDVSDMDPINQIKSKYGIDISIIGVSYEIFSGWKTANYWNLSVYLRMLIPDMINEEKIIYLDSDTIVLGDLLEMYEIDLTNTDIAGVEDINKGKGCEVPRTTGDRYINAGVMLMNLEELRRNGFLEECKKIYYEYKDEITIPDQDIINKYADMKKTIIEEKWNLQVFVNHVKEDNWKNIVMKKKISIVHFIGETKPWSQWCSPFISDFWLSYANKLNLPKMRQVKISNVNQMISLSMSLDLNEKHKESSMLKSQILKLLLGSRPKA